MTRKRRGRQEGSVYERADGVCDTTGEWLRKSNFIRNVYDPIRLKAGLAGIRFHHWRHFDASYLIDPGMSAKVLQERLGHADVATTMRFYIHSRQESHRQAAEAIDSSFNEPRTLKSKKA